MPHYAIILFAPTTRDESAIRPNERAEHERHSEQLQAEGDMIAAFILEDAVTATAVRATTITDGPYIESKEVIAGLYVVELPDLDAAIAHARRNPILSQGGGMEVRPVEDFGMWPKETA